MMSKDTSFPGKFAIVLLCFSTVLQAQESPLDPRLTKFEINRLVRFTSLEEANLRREKLIRFIWPKGLPLARPKVTRVQKPCEELSVVDASRIERIERLDCDLDGLDFQGAAFVAFPAKPTKNIRIAIVFAGHMPEGVDNYLSSGLSQSIEALLDEGFVVAAMQMPLVGWNQDKDGVLPSGKRFSIGKRQVAGHDELLAAVESELKGGFMRFFLEPIVMTLNELVARFPDHDGVLMTGLSGGGWTTQLAAAIDTRITASIPVAGSLPLYARPFSPGSRGDAEQEYGPIFRETDSDGDGVLDTAAGICSWLEIYALGGLPANDGLARKQMQVINLYDPCCFSGYVHTTYSEAISQRAAKMTGDWTVVVDDSHRDHLISSKVIEQFLIPTARTLSKNSRR